MTAGLRIALSIGLMIGALCLGYTSWLKAHANRGRRRSKAPSLVYLGLAMGGTLLAIAVLNS